MNNQLSSAAQAVLDAYKNAPDLMLDGDPDEVERRLGLAAALRAAVDQLLIRSGIPRSEYSSLMRVIDGQFRAIAAELEGQS